MTDLEKILERGEYNKDAVVNVAKHEDSDGYFGFLSGAEWQHGELMPVIRALCEVIELQREALQQLQVRVEDYALAGNIDCYYYEQRDGHAKASLSDYSELAESAIADSDKRLKELAGEK